MAYRKGLVSNLGNPKMAVFFTSLLPQFGSSFAALVGLGILLCALTLAWLSAYAVVVDVAEEPDAIQSTEHVLLLTSRR